MIFKQPFRNNRGNVLVYAIAVILAGLFLTYTVIRNTTQHANLTKRSSNETAVIMTAHAYANLLKQDLLANYTTYEANSGNAWSACRVTGGVTNFLGILKNPMDSTYAPNGTCPSKSLTFSYFAVAGSASVTLQNFKTAVFIPNELLNGFTTQLTITDFNLDTSRNQLIGNIQLSISKPLPIQKLIRFVIDLKRTTDTPRNLASCAVCRTTPGAVCCGGLYKFTYVDTTGTLIDAAYNLETKTLTEQPNPDYNTVGGADQTMNGRYVSVKIGLGRGPSLDPRRNYDNESFCMDQLQSDPVLWVTDAFTGVDCADPTQSVNYYLTTHGNIVKNESSPFPGSAYDPKIISVAYRDGLYHLLRSDGAILTSRDICTPDSWSQVGDLVVPRAEKLAMGDSPVPASSPGTCP